MTDPIYPYLDIITHDRSYISVFGYTSWNKDIRLCKSVPFFYMALC